MLLRRSETTVKKSRNKKTDQRSLKKLAMPGREGNDQPEKVNPIRI
jgi:hypothetical protein